MFISDQKLFRETRRKKTPDHTGYGFALVGAHLLLSICYALQTKGGRTGESAIISPAQQGFLLRLFVTFDKFFLFLFFFVANIFAMQQAVT